MKKITILIMLLAMTVPVFSRTRLKEITHIDGQTTVKLIGYGLVVGLDGTGDSRSARFTITSVTNMLSKFGIEVDPQRLIMRNVAAVMVTAEMTPFSREGSKIDVLVSSLGDARSLKGGTLLMTPLTLNGEDIFAVAQGPTFVGRHENHERGFGYLRHNQTLVSRIPAGGTIIREFESPVASVRDSLNIFLNSPDFTNAVRVAQSINVEFPDAAVALDASTVRLRIPEQFRTQAGLPMLLSFVEQLEIETDAENKIIINERTGTLVAGRNVRLLPVSIAHDNLSIRIGDRNIVERRQVNVAGGNIDVAPQTQVSARELITETDMINVARGNITVGAGDVVQIDPVGTEEGRVVVMPETTTLQDLANALNELGVRPRDLITIIQLLKRSGAINATIEVM